MFKQLFSALTSETSIDQAYADLTQMLEHGAWMFSRANEVLYSTVAAEDVRTPCTSATWRSTSWSARFAARCCAT
ncbi:hypothetical protein HAALTHF_52210n [Vreelandella aquamarina]|nr:hypothetical protein HAALTHF_52210n [Halomonas axialensis]